MIKDTGIGIDPSFIPKIFDSFTQEDSSRNNKYGSTGLGMAIAKNIVELMNGSITVESEKGAGSAFTVIVILKNSEHQGPTIGSINPGEMRVLVVDDEEVAAEHARIVLDEAGIQADTCLNGPEALNMMEIAHTKHMPYNLVLLDWKMPDMDGLEVTRQIRRQYARETTVIILTSFNWDEIMDEALHAGVDSFLSKPLFASNVIDEFERIARKNNMSLFREKKACRSERTPYTFGGGYRYQCRDHEAADIDEGSGDRSCRKRQDRGRNVLPEQNRVLRCHSYGCPHADYGRIGSSSGDPCAVQGRCGIRSHHRSYS